MRSSSSEISTVTPPSRQTIFPKELLPLCLRLSLCRLLRLDLQPVGLDEQPRYFGVELAKTTEGKPEPLLDRELLEDAPPLGAPEFPRAAC